jgi:ABC-type branched-subunit amino acid transport system substrate-binding protein
LVAVLLLAASACGRSSDNGSNANSGSKNSGSNSASSSGSSLLASGGFGDMQKVCGPGDAKGATDVGVTDTEIHVGTITDKGAQIRPNLDAEMSDAAVAFAKWCNEKGGILGRKIVVDDLDAALFNYGAVITSACPKEFSLVGGGAVFDDADNGQRVACGLPSIPGYVVTPKARSAALQVQPLPNPVYQAQVGPYKALDAMTNGGLQHYGTITGALATTQQVRDANVEAVSLVGGNTVYSNDYNPQGESNWTPFIDDLQSKGVKIFEFVGEPENLGALQTAMATAGYTPDATVLTPNFYDQKYLSESGANAKNTYIRTSFYPFEMASQNQATQDYLDLMKQYNPGGKVALLGAQAVSAYLLFAQAATACGSNLTRQCLLDKAKVTNWTGGGLHAATNPAANSGGTCYALITVQNGKFVLAADVTKPNQGIFNCDPGNVVTLQKDYGVPR